MLEIKVNSYIKYQIYKLFQFCRIINLFLKIRVNIKQVFKNAHLTNCAIFQNFLNNEKTNCSVILSEL